MSRGTKKLSIAGPCTVARSCVLQLFPASVQFRSQQLPSWDPQLTGPTGVDGGFLVQPNLDTFRVPWGCCI